MVANFDGFEINPIHEGDAWKICDLINTNLERFKRYFPETLKQNLTPTLSQLFVEKMLKAFRSKTVFLYTLKETETRKLAGLIYLKEIDWVTKEGEFAYCIDYTFGGQGLISKAVQELSNYSLETLELETLKIIINKDNKSSEKIALKNNYTWKKTLKEIFTPPGEKALDMELYELYKN